MINHPALERAAESIWLVLFLAPVPGPQSGKSTKEFVLWLYKRRRRAPHC